MLKLIGCVLIASIAISTITGIFGFFVDLVRFGKKQYEEDITPSSEGYAERLEAMGKEVDEYGTSNSPDHSALSDIRL